jgi:calcineurin-like phosphoesterase family protein
MVYFLGDLAFGRGSKNTDYWIKKLKGEIIFIKGNHDRSKTIRFHKVFYFTYKGIDFVLVHSPFNSPVGWKNWIIHGHEHNHSINFPFIDKKTKRINVSCELTDYCPVDIDIIINKIKESDA